MLFYIALFKVILWPSMTTKAGLRHNEGLMMIQELDDRLKEQIDKLEHLRLVAVELKDNLLAVHWASSAVNHSLP